MPDSEHIIGATDNDTHETSFADLSPWTDELGQTYGSFEICWALLQEILAANQNERFTRTASTALRVAFKQAVLDNVREVLQQPHCPDMTPDLQVPSEWDVVVNRSQPVGDIWGGSGSQWYAHPLFQNQVVVAREAEGASYRSAEIDQVQVFP